MPVFELSCDQRSNPQFIRFIVANKKDGPWPM